MRNCAVTMRIVSILLSLSMVLSTIGNGTAGFDCAANVTDAQGHGASYSYDKDSRLIKTLIITHIRLGAWSDG